MNACRLPHRGVVKVVGEEARAFLQRVVSCDMQKVSPAQAAYGALLTPQGKIIVDFLALEAPENMGGGFLLDAPRALAPDLMKRLNLYRLRAKVIIEDISDVLSVAAAWGSATRPDEGLAFTDPRNSALGWRQFLMRPLAETPESADAYDAHRIALAVPEGGRDFLYGDAFPHEANMDLLGGLDFAKGCYVGQEVVSRMQHKTEIRKRVTPVGYEGPAPQQGLEVMAGERVIGRMGSAAVGKGLAMLRLDHVRDAFASGVMITVGAGVIRPVLREPGS